MRINKHFFNAFRKHIIYIVLILVAAVMGSLPLLHSGLYTAHDIWHQVARLYHYSEAVSDGQFFPTWISTLSQGHGYPLFLFSYHFPWILGTPLVLMGASIEFALKFLFFVAYLASGWAMYALAWHITKNKTASLGSAVLYLFAPYHFLTMYVSAAIGTQFQFAILPLLFLGAAWILDKRPRWGFILLSISIATGILTHLITFAYFMLALLLYIAFILSTTHIAANRKRKIVALLFLSLFLGILLSSFYLVPFVAYKNEIIASLPGNGFTDIYKSNFASLRQLIYSKWGFGPIISNAKDGEISLQIGIAQWLGAFFATLLVITSMIFRKKFKNENVFFLSLFGLSIFGMLSISEPLWSFVTKIVSFDYPFRLLLISVFSGSLLAAFVITSVKKYKLFLYGACGFFIMIAMYTNRNHIKVNLYTDVPLDLYVRSETTTNTFHEYLPLGASSQLLSKDAQSVAISENKTSVPIVSNLAQTTNSLFFDVEIATPSAISISQFSFPGQRLYVNKKFVEHSVDGSGRIQTSLTEGRHSVLVQYEDTTPILFGKVLTVLGMVFLVRFYIAESRKDEK